jgi:hypothetical protein
MPLDLIWLVTAVTAFAIFAGTLFWADRRTRKLNKQKRGKSIAFDGVNERVREFRANRLRMVGSRRHSGGQNFRSDSALFSNLLMRSGLGAFRFESNQACASRIDLLLGQVGTDIRMSIHWKCSGRTRWNLKSFADREPVAMIRTPGLDGQLTSQNNNGPCSRCDNARE